MIATIQIGNSDNKLTQQEWSQYVSEVRDATTEEGVETHFFASSEGSQPWQNACWVIAIHEAEVDAMLSAITTIRKKYRQKSIAVVLGDVRMI